MATEVYISEETTFLEITIIKKHVDEGGKEAPKEGEDKRFFNPLQLAEVKEFAPELYNACREMWTAEVIEAWEKHQKHQKELEEVMNPQ